MSRWAEISNRVNKKSRWEEIGQRVNWAESTFEYDEKPTSTFGTSDRTRKELIDIEAKRSALLRQQRKSYGRNRRGRRGVSDATRELRAYNKENTDEKKKKLIKEYNELKNYEDEQKIKELSSAIIKRLDEYNAGKDVSTSGFTKDEFKELAKARERTSNKLNAEKEVLEAMEYAKAHPVLGSIKSVGENFVSGLLSPVDAFAQKMVDPYRDLDTYSKATQGSRNAQYARGAVREQIDNEILGGLYNIGMSAADSAVNMLVGNKLGGRAGADLMFGLTGATSGGLSIAERGGTDDQIFGTALTSGALAAATGHMPTEKLLSLSSMRTASVKGFARELAKTMGIEATEETIEEAGNILYDSLANGDISNVQLQYDKLIRNGVTPKEAKAEVAKTLAGQLAYSGVAGALMGGAFGAGAMTTGNIRYARSAKKMSDEVKSDVVKYAQNQEGEAGRLYRESIGKDGMKNAGLGMTAEAVQSDIVNKIFAAKDMNSLVEAYDSVVKEAESNEVRNLADRAYRTQVGRIKAGGGIAQMSEESLAQADEKSNIDQVVDREEKGFKDEIRASVPALTKAGKAVEITGVKDNKYVTANGEAVEYDDITFDNQTNKVLMQSAANYDGEVQQDFIANYKGGPVADYQASFNALMQYGKLGRNITLNQALEDNRARIELGYISREGAIAAYKAGRATVKDSVQKKAKTVKREKGYYVENGAKASEGMRELLKAFAEKTGVATEYTDFIDADGQSANGQFISAVAKIAIAAESVNELETLGHEGTHFAKAYASEEYQKMEDAIIRYIAQSTGAKNTESYIESEMKHRKMSREDLIEEMVSDFMGGICGTEEGARAFIEYLMNDKSTTVQEKKSILQSVIDFIDKILNELKAMINGEHLSSVAKFAAEEQYDDIKHIQELFFAALDEASKNLKSGNAESDSDNKKETFKYSLELIVPENTINDYVDRAYENTNEKDYIKYAKPSQRLIKDVQEELDLSGYSHALRDNDIRHIRNSHGGNNEKYPVTKDDIKRIPEIVSNYDKVIVSHQNGKTGIVYVKVSEDGLVYYLEQVTTQYGNTPMLVNKQMIKTGINSIPNIKGIKEGIIKKQSEVEFLTDLNQVHQVYAQSVRQHSSVKNSIPKDGSKGNIKKSLSADGEVKNSIKGEKTQFAKTRATTKPTEAPIQKMFASIREVRNKTMKENGFADDEIEATNMFFDQLMDFMEEAEIKYEAIGLKDINNAELQVRYDRKGNVKSVIMSAMVKNGEYPINFDFSSICKKRQSLAMVIEELSKRKDGSGKRYTDTFKLTADKLMAINEALREEGLETACLGCFVEAKRFNVQNFADKACEMWNSIVDEVRAEQGKKGKPDSFNFAEGVDTDSIDFDEVDAVFSKYEEEKERTSPAKRMRALIKNGGATYQKYLSPSDLMTPQGIQAIKTMSTRKNNFYGILKGVYGQAAPKEVMAFSPYNSEIALLPKTKSVNRRSMSMAKYLTKIGGIRAQSFSDFLIANIYDYMQLIADASARRFPMHMYTKEIACAKLLGMTGVKINLSVMFDIDANLPDEYAGLTFVEDNNGDASYNGKVGRWEYLVGDKARADREEALGRERPFVQSIGFDEAVELQNDPNYSNNVGIIGVGYSRNHILKMLDDVNIKYIIPYHSSSLPATIKAKTRIDKATDYTPFQNTRKIVSVTDSNGNPVKLNLDGPNLGDSFADLYEKIDSGEYVVKTEAMASLGSFDIYEDVARTNNPKKTANNYLEYCAENNCLPVFEEFADHENYYKFLFDFSVYNHKGEYAPQVAVQNIYPGYNYAEGMTSTDTIKAMVEEEMSAQNAINLERNAKMPRVVDNAIQILSKEDIKNSLFNEEKVNINEFSASAGNLEDIRFSITEESTEIERYEELRNKNIAIVPYNPARLAENDIEIEAMIDLVIQEATPILKTLAKKLGLFKIYENKSIQLEFNFGTNNLRESLSKQKKNRNNDKFADYAKLLSCFEDVVANAELIEVHRDDEGHNEASNFLRAHVLVSSFKDGEYIVPVKLLVKEFDRMDNVLYVSMTVQKIKEVEPMRQRTSKEHISPSSTFFEISLSDLLPKIKDETLKKYIPAQFYTKEETKFSVNNETTRLIKQNEKLQEINKNLKQQMKLTKGVRLDDRVIGKLARRIARQYGSSYDGLQEELTQLYNYVASGDITFEELQSVSSGIARNVLDNIRQKNVLTDDARTILNDIKAVKITLNETQKQEAAYMSDSYNNYRKSLFGRVNIGNDGVSLDTQWQEWAEQYPNLFDASLSDAEQVIALKDIVNVLSNSYVDEYGFDIDEASEVLGYELLNEYFSIPEVRTFADKQKAKYDKLKLESAQKLREYKKESRDKYEDKLREVKAELRDVKRQASRDRKQYSEDIVRAIAKTRTYEREKFATREGKAKYRRRIEKTVKKINRLFMKNEDLKNVPDRMKVLVSQFMQEFTNDTSVFNGAKLGDLANFYKRIETNENYVNLAAAYDEDVAQMLDDLRETIDGKRLSKLTVEELSMVSDIMSNLYHMIRSENEVIIGGRRESLREVGEKACAENTRANAQKRMAFTGSEWFKTCKRFFGDGNISPQYFFGRMGGVMNDLYEDFLNAQDNWAIRMQTSQDKFAEIAERNHYYDWDLNEKIAITTEDGEVELTPGQLMLVYATGKREQLSGQDSMHIFEGGLTLRDYVSKETRTIGGKAVKLNVVDPNKTFRFTFDQYVEACAKLTEEQLAMADELVAYLSTDLAKWGNEASLEMYGITKFNESYYIPFNSDPNFIYSQQGGIVNQMNKFKSASFTKKTVKGAKNPLILDDIVDVWTSHVGQMVSYSTMVIPLDNMNKVFNYKKQDDEGKISLKEVIANTYTQDATRYIDQFMTDVNGGVATSPVDQFVKKYVSLFKKGATYASLSVVVQQPTSVARAMLYINPKYFVGTDKIDYEQLKKYAPIAIVKSMGRFDTMTGMSSKEWLTKRKYASKADALKNIAKDKNVVEDAFGYGAVKGDELGWGILWNACKREVADKQGLSGDELLIEAGKRFRYVANQTQVYDSVLAKSQNMRSNTAVSSMVMSFMAEPTVGLNMMMDGIIKARKGDYKFLARATGAFMASGVLAAFMKAFVSAARDDDEDKTYIEKWLGKFAGGTWDNINPVNMIPIARDVYSMYEGYSVERTDLAVISDLMTAIKGLESTSKTPREKIVNLAGAVGNMFGIPARNIYRDVTAAVRMFGNMTSDKETTVYGIGKSVREELGVDKSKTDYAKDLLKVWNKDVSKQAKVIGTLQKEYDMAVRSGADADTTRSNYKRVITTQLKPVYMELSTSEKIKFKQMLFRIRLGGVSLYDNEYLNRYWVD